VKKEALGNVLPDFVFLTNITTDYTNPNIQDDGSFVDGYFIYCLTVFALSNSG
jgi:hypothetical protein